MPAGGGEPGKVKGQTNRGKREQEQIEVERGLVERCGAAQETGGHAPVMLVMLWARVYAPRALAPRRPTMPMATRVEA